MLPGLLMSDKDSNRNIVLGGFMGTGKTTVGELIAAKLYWPFVDADAEIVSRFGKTIPEIFEQQGEGAFRRFETVIAQSLAARTRTVIATGGGMLVDPANLAMLESTGFVVCLNATPEAIEARLGDGEGRPLVWGWRDLLEDRRAAYAQIPHQIETTGREPDEVAEEIIALWRKST